MTLQKKVFEKLVKDQKELESYGVKSLSVFGSFAKGKEREKSDIDLLVSFKKPVGLFEFMKLRDHLEGVLGKQVDLVTEQALHPYLREKILKESIHVL